MSEAEKKMTAYHEAGHAIIGIKLEEMKYLNDSIGMENRILLMKSISSFLFDTFGKHNVYRLSRSKLAVIIGTDDVKNQKQLTELQVNTFTCCISGNQNSHIYILLK